MTDTPPKYLSTADIAAVLGVTVMTLCNWRKAGVGPPCVRRGYEYRYSRPGFQDYMERLTGGDPIPADLTPGQKRKFFSQFHRDNPLADDPPLAELAERLAGVERILLVLSKKLAEVDEAMAALARIGLAGVAKPAKAARIEAKRQARATTKAMLPARAKYRHPSLPST